MTDRCDELRADLSPGEGLVTLVRPGTEKDVTLLSAWGEIRFLEGRSVRGVPLRIARKLAGPGWTIEPLVVLREETDERSQA